MPKKVYIPTGEKGDEYLSLVNELQMHNLNIQQQLNTCNFVSQGSVTAEYLDGVLEKVHGVDEQLLLKQGIGYYHAGCHKKNRDATEILFRSKYVQVVAATATLALGIHMPCKTVVFVGDDQYVDALNYRQMAGRSGRRGYDNIGNVVFYGVPVRKISQFVNADLRSLDGLYPISCTLVLRLLLLASNSENKESAHKKAMVVLSHPFFTYQKPSLQKQLQHFFLFVTDHLIRQLLIDEKGVPLQFAGLVSHLHYFEPGNMVFVYLLRKGIFHDVCKPLKTNKCIHYGHTCVLCRVSPIIGKMYHGKIKQIDLCQECYKRNKPDRFSGIKFTGGDFFVVDPPLKYVYSETTLRLLVCILCHVFCTKEISHNMLKHDIHNSHVLKLKISPSYGSKVLLDPLPPPFVAAVESYNKAVESNFSNYLCVVGQSIPKKCYATLPLSRGQWKTDLPEAYLDKEQDTSAVNPFVQLSGCANKHIKKNCLMREEIFRMLPPEIFMDFKSIPALYIDVPKNAYALDFFKHKSTNALEQDNVIATGEIYQSLKDFMLLIMAISTALEELGPEECDDHVIAAFKHLSFEYRARFSECFPDARIKF